MALGADNALAGHENKVLKNEDPQKSRSFTIEDDAGITASFPGPAQRIVCLYGAFNEILLALDAGDLLVAKTNADNNLPELEKLPSVGTHMRPNLEIVRSLNPDVVLQMGGRKEISLQAEALRNLGMQVLTFDINSFADLFAAVEKLGRLTGREEAAQKLVSSWKKRLNDLQKRHAGRKSPTVFYEIRSPDLLAAGQKGIINDIIKAAGGINVVDIPRKIARLNAEMPLKSDPDAYVYQKGPMNPDPENPARRPLLAPLKAIRANRILEVDEQIFARPGPNSIKAAEDLENWLFPATNSTDDK